LLKNEEGNQGQDGDGRKGDEEEALFQDLFFGHSSTAWPLSSARESDSC